MGSVYPPGLFAPDEFSPLRIEDHVFRTIAHQRYREPRFCVINGTETAADSAAMLGDDVTDELDGGIAEVTTIQTVAKADLANGEYFWLYANDGDGTETAHYFWFDVDTAGSDPSPGSGTGHEVAIDGDTTAADVASTLQGVIDALAGFGAAAATDTVTVTNANAGAATDASDVDTTFTITTVTDGAESDAGILLDVVSASASDDDAAAGHVREVTLFGITDGDAYVSEVVAMNGQTAVTTTNKYKRLIRAQATDWGTGGADAAGNITVSENGGTTKNFMQIDAGSNIGYASKFYVPTGYSAILRRLTASYYEAPAADALDVDRAATILIKYGEEAGSDESGDESDLAPRLKLLIGPYHTETYEDWVVLEGGDDTYLEIQAENVDTSNDASLSFQALFLVWKTTFPDPDA